MYNILIQVVLSPDPRFDIGLASIQYMSIFREMHRSTPWRVFTVNLLITHVDYHEFYYVIRREHEY